MSKPSDKYLEAVVDLYKNFVNNGDIMPLEFIFPSFKVTKGIFNFYAIDALSERARIGIDTGMYGLQKYSEDINYEELIDYTARKKRGLTTILEDKTTGLMIEKILSEKIKQDTSMTPSEARNGALAGSCIKTMDYKVQELINFEYFKPEINNQLQDNNFFFGAKEKINFIATLLTMKELLPQIYRKIIDSLDERQSIAEDSIKYYIQTNNEQLRKDLEIGMKQNVKISELIIDLKESATNPNTAVIERALEVDPSLTKSFIEKYPLIMKQVFKDSVNIGKTYKM